MQYLLVAHAALHIAKAELTVQIVACGKQVRPFHHNQRVKLTATHRVYHFARKLGHQRGMNRLRLRAEA